MKFGFAVGDIGGARALMPVMHLAVKNNINVNVFFHGSIIDETKNKSIPWKWIAPSSKIKDLEFDVFAFSSSVFDMKPLNWAIELKNKSIPVLHLLDHWGNYKKRLTNQNKIVLHPNIYAVMDSLSFKGVASSGFENSTIKITGSPALSKITKKKNINKSGPLIFISEPVAHDQGINSNYKNFRGYTELEVIELLLKVKKKIQLDKQVWIFLHPREDKKNICNLLSKYSLPRIDVLDGITQKEKRRLILESASGIIGMNSILLHELWLKGYPILSIQPNLLNKSDQHLINKPGVTHCNKQEHFLETFSNWINTRTTSKFHLETTMKERSKHKFAAENVLNCLKSLIK